MTRKREAGAPRADIVAEGEALISQIQQAEENLAAVRERLEAYLKNLAALDDDLAMIDAIRRLARR